VGADVDHRHPDASADYCAWGTWVMDELSPGMAGFRFDAVKVC
jgi:alpha-amylase